MGVEVCLLMRGHGSQAILAKGEKDAKQLAAASLLEVMLDHVPFQDLLYKSEKQQSFKDIQVWGVPLPLCCDTS